MSTQHRVKANMSSSVKSSPKTSGNAPVLGAVVLILGLVAVIYGDEIADMVKGVATFSSLGLVVVVVLVVVTVLVIVLPLLLGEAEAPEPQTEIPLSHLGTPRQNRALEILYAEKDRLLRAVRDLDFDYDVGKLSDDAYAEQRVLLMRQAAAVVAKIDELEDAIAAQQARVEAALAAFRQSRRGQA